MALTVRRAAAVVPRRVVANLVSFYFMPRHVVNGMSWALPTGYSYV